MQGRVLVVGLERKLYLKIEPLLSRSLLSVDRVPKGESGVLLTDKAVFDLIVIRHPLPDMALGSLMNRVHAPGSPCGAASFLILTDQARIEEVRNLLPANAKQVLSIDQPAKLLEEVAGRLLGVAPRVSTRTLVRLEVQLESGKTLLTCQSENLSDQGMLLRTDTVLPIGTRVRYECTLPGERAPITGEAEVKRHAVPDVENIHGMGLKIIFVKGDGAAKLRRFVAGKAPR
jgi:CheY-like chemotaxis protein